jgi:hypothetical protein
MVMLFFYVLPIKLPLYIVKYIHWRHTRISTEQYAGNKMKHLMQLKSVVYTF